MPINPYFNNFDYAREQELMEALAIESIKMYGYDVRYIPRTLVNEDDLFGEDRLSTFNAAMELEAYIKNVEGFEGEGDFLSRFNLEIRDQITFTIARKRFNQARSEKLSSESGFNYVLENGFTDVPSRKELSESYIGFNIELETATSEGYSVTNNRPLEGDLLYFPLTEGLFEIKFVEHEAIFYQSGRLQTYDIRCELFTYSSERLLTGNTIIDAHQTSYSVDILAYEMLNEDGTVVLLEDGGSLMQEYAIETTQPTAGNAYLESQSNSGIVDFSEINPLMDG